MGSRKIVTRLGVGLAGGLVAAPLVGGVAPFAKDVAATSSPAAGLLRQGGVCDLAPAKSICDELPQVPGAPKAPAMGMAGHDADVMEPGAAQA
jgi:hypothetical protein